MPKHTKLYTFIEPVPIVKKPKIKLKDIFMLRPRASSAITYKK